MVAPPGYVEPPFGSRFLARFCDGALVALVSVFIALLVDHDGLVRLLVTAAYEIPLVAWRGQTLGKYAFGLRIVDAEGGGIPSPLQATLRWAAFLGLVSALDLVAGNLGGLWVLALAVSILPGPYHQGPHDRIAGTIVTRVH